MKITNVTAELYAKPYSKPISNGKYTYVASKNVMVRITTDEGIEGVGIGGGGGFSSAPGSDIVVTTVNDMAAVLIGEDPFNVERIWA
ncbi:MAG TPA: enolase, partial [Chloroflexi bacterium]|nr:enolase [Chloroflexota bacterium]